MTNKKYFLSLHYFTFIPKHIFFYFLSVPEKMFGYKKKCKKVTNNTKISNLVFVGYTISAPNHLFSYGTEVAKFKPNPAHTPLQLEIKSKIFSEVKYITPYLFTSVGDKLIFK